MSTPVFSICDAPLSTCQSHIKYRLVKKALKEGYKAGIYSEYSKDVIRPSAKECAQNGRARSTKMRYARKGDL